MKEPFLFSAGPTPLLVSLPHDSRYIPKALALRMTPEALQVADTDWHVARLYDFAGAIGASVLCATHSRYVVDLNRDPAGNVLYADRKSVVSGKSVSVRVDLGGRRSIKKQNHRCITSADLNTLASIHIQLLPKTNNQKPK